MMVAKVEYEVEEDAADIVAYDAAKAEIGGSEKLPFEVSQLALRGNGVTKALRIWRDMTQLDLCHRTSLSQGFTSDLESGRRKLTPEVADRLAAALDIPIHWLH